MKRLLFILSFLYSTLIYSQNDDIAYELWIHNRSTTADIYVKIIPQGVVFNGARKNNAEKDYSYSPEAFKDLSPEEHNFVFAGNKFLRRVIGNYDVEINSFPLTYDMGTSNWNSGCDSVFGLGKYKIEFWAIGNNGDLEYQIDWLTVDYTDYDLPTNYPNVDLNITFYSENNIVFAFPANEISIHHPLVNRELKVWYQIKSLDPLTIWQKQQNKDNFRTTSETEGLSYLLLPIKSTNYVGEFFHIDPEICYVNLNVPFNQTAKIKCDEVFVSSTNSRLRLMSSNTTGAVFKVGDQENNSYCDARYQLRTLAMLDL